MKNKTQSIICNLLNVQNGGSYHRISFFAFLILLLAACNHTKVDLTYLKSTTWQWDSGYKIGDGDMVEFDSTGFFALSNDTIFKKGIPKSSGLARAFFLKGVLYV